VHGILCTVSGARYIRCMVYGARCILYTLGISWIDSIEHHCRHPIYDPITQALHMCLILRHRIRPRCPSLCASRCPPRALAFGYRLEAWSLAITFRLGLWLSPRGLVFGYHLEAWSLAITSRLGLWLSPRGLVFGYHLEAWSLAITSSLGLWLSPRGLVFGYHLESDLEGSLA